MTTCRYTLTLNEYPVAVQTSAHQREKYYEPKDRKLIGQKLALRIHNEEVIWSKMKNGKLCLFDKATGQFIVRNASQAGTAKMVTINANLLYAAGAGASFIRQKITDFLHAYFKEHIMMNLPARIEIPEGKFMQTEFVFYEPLSVKSRGKMDWLNKSFLYVKSFEDTMQEMNIITNDNPTFVRGGYARYVDILGSDIEGSQQRRMEVRIHFLNNTENMQQ